MEESDSNDIKVDISPSLACGSTANLPSGSHKFENMGQPVIKEEVLENVNITDEIGGDDLPIPTDLKIEIGEVNLVKQEGMNEDVIINSDTDNDNADDDDDVNDEEARTTYLDYPEKEDSRPPSGDETPTPKYEWIVGSKTFTLTKEMKSEKVFGAPLADDIIATKVIWQITVLKTRYVCPRCQKEFAQTVHLRVHLITTHFNIKGYTCRACKRKFGTEKGLTSHQNIHCQQRTEEEPSHDLAWQARSAGYIITPRDLVPPPTSKGQLKTLPQQYFLLSEGTSDDMARQGRNNPVGEGDIPTPRHLVTQNIKETA